MGPNTVRVLATLCCALGLALVILGATLCPQSLYANQGTAKLSPCAIDCFQDCETLGQNQCGSGTTTDHCNAVPGLCNQCRCKPIPGATMPPFCICE